MTSPFEQYADENGYRGLPKREEKIAKGPSQLDLKMAEKDRLSRAYRKTQVAKARELFAREPRLKDFRRYIKTVSAGDADDMVEAIETSWLPACDRDVRLFALSLVNARCQRIRLLMGLNPIDDPLPPETNAYFRVRDILHPGSRH